MGGFGEAGERLDGVRTWVRESIYSFYISGAVGNPHNF